MSIHEEVKEKAAEIVDKYLPEKYNFNVAVNTIERKNMLDEIYKLVIQEADKAYDVGCRDGRNELQQLM